MNLEPRTLRDLWTLNDEKPFDAINQHDQSEFHCVGVSPHDEKALGWGPRGYSLSASGHERAWALKAPLPSSIELIRMERERQITKEGRDAEHDDEHTGGELALAAACYAAHNRGASYDPMDIFELGDFIEYRFSSLWPWTPKYDKRKKHPYKRRLVIAGALIVAELDRLQRAEDTI